MNYQNYKFEWSFGEAMAIETFTPAANLAVTSGVLQPFTNTPATINLSGGWGPEEIRILPNPVQNQMGVYIFSKQTGSISVNLYDEAGKFITRHTFDYPGTQYVDRWNFTPYPSGNYFLNIVLVPTGTSVAKKGGFKVIKLY